MFQALCKGRLAVERVSKRARALVELVARVDVMIVLHSWWSIVWSHRGRLLWRRSAHGTPGDLPPPQRRPELLSHTHVTLYLAYTDTW